MQDSERKRSRDRFWWYFSLLTLLLGGLCVWGAVDAVLPIALRYAAERPKGDAAPPRVDREGEAATRSPEWTYNDSLDVRIDALWLLMILGAFIVLLCLIELRKRKVTLLKVSLITALGICWCAVIVFHNDLLWIALTSRTRRALPSFRKVATHLEVHWPAPPRNVRAIETNIPELGRVGMRRAGPGASWVCNFRYIDQKETFGAFIEIDHKKKIMRFELVDDTKRVEYHPKGTKPSSYMNFVGVALKLQRMSRLADHWFVVEYAR